MALLINCLSRHDVEEQLRRIPKGLDESYDRIVNQIDERRHEDTRNFSQWLALSVRPVMTQYDSLTDM